MHLRRSAFLKYFIGFLVVAAFYCEWFVYIIQPLFWPELKCNLDETCTKILFIADPQIQGELEAPSPFNYLFIYDSDQYLKSTYSTVTGHFKPNVLVYLGDNMHQGSKATMPQYYRYVERVKYIFDSTYTADAEIWVPGDNDIGGEKEPIKKEKIEAFESSFKKNSVVTSRNISFYKVNGITNSIPKLVDNATSAYKIAVSHYLSLFFSKFYLRNEVVNKIHPDIMFNAHSIDSKYVINSNNFATRHIYKFSQAGETLQVLPDGDTIYEISVPTCSYRMGTSDIGYGAAIYEHKSRVLTYAVFWSSQRFPYLFFYLAVLIFIIIYSLVFYSVRWCKRRNSLSISSKDNIPLLTTTGLFSDGSKLF